MKILNLKLLLVLSILVMLTACGTYTTIRHKNNYQDSLNRPGQMLILPPNIEVNMIGTFGRKERMYEYEYHLEDLIYRQIKDSLKGKNYRAKIFRKRDIKNLDLSESFHKFRIKYEKAQNELYKPLSMLVDKAYNTEKNIGNDADVINKTTDSQFLIIIDYNRTVKTSGARTLDLAKDLLFNQNESDNVDNAAMFIGIVEAATGDILWTNYTVQNKNIFLSGLESLSDRNKIDVDDIKEITEKLLYPLKNKN